MPQPYLTLILPAYNESGRIENTVADAVRYFEQKAMPYEIIVSADGNDGTREIVARMGQANPALKVIGENARRGKGRGIRDAVAIATGRFVGFADADNKVPITEFDRVQPELEAGHLVVIGSRAMQNSQIERKQPWFRQIGSRGFRVFLHTLVGLRSIHDTQCGFKFFPREIARNLFKMQQIDGYMYDVEILVLAEKLGYSIAQVPVRWRDDNDSRLDLVSGNIRNVRDIWRIRQSTRQTMLAAPEPITSASGQVRGK